ncbi:MAG: hypothetical protein ACE37J_21845 [Pikeienuella sp.]|uniref:hypothetical protein n=1 Tax=Pikeienuella sp. TaxID=2831957 RepID=UPI003919385B
MRNTRLLLSAAVAAALAAPAAAETASTTLDVTVALQPALTVSCTDTDFGIVRVRPSAQTNTSIITFTDANTVAITSDGGGVSLSGTPSASTCTVSGSSAANGSTLFISDNIGSRTFGAAAEGGPSTAANLSFSSSQYNDGSDVTVTDGSATFTFITGIFIPSGIVADNFGNYVTTVTITVDDNI